jgi:predicted ATPase
VPGELMRTLDVRRGPDQTALEAVADRIDGEELLLILDNCEHVVEGVASAVETLLKTCPGLRVLATSREPMRLPGEIVRRVSSLRAPDPANLPPADEINRFDAIRLFRDRVQAVHEQFEIDDDNARDVAQVCFRLDGMPLALELAAARVPTLSVAGVAKNLDDRFGLLVDGPRTALSRQQTLKATVDWSFDLLSAQEQSLFLGLSVFKGPFDLEAAQSVAHSELERGGEIASLLSRLVERSMVATITSDGVFRYRLLETMREYGLDLLRSQGTLQEARDLHAKWMLQLSESGGGLTDASGRADLVSRLSGVHDELRPAVDHLLATHPKDAARLSSRLWPYWLWLAHLGEGLDLIEEVLEHVAEPSIHKAELLLAASAIAFRWKGFEEMERLATLSAEESKALGDHAAVGRALLFAAIGPFDRDDFDRTGSLFEEAKVLAQSEGDVALEISANLSLAMLSAFRLDYAGAGELLDRAEILASSLDASTGVLDLYTLGAWAPTRRRGERVYMWRETFISFEDGIGREANASIATAKANLERLSGRLDEAEVLLEATQRDFVSAGDESGQSLALSWMGQLAFDRGDLDTAEDHLSRSLSMRSRIGHVRGVVASLIGLIRLMADRSQFDHAARYLDEAEELCRQRADRIGVALVGTERAQVAMARGDAESAVSLLNESLPVITAFGEFGLNIACAMRDLGEAQSLAGLVDEAKATLTDAEDIFERTGHEDEASRCRKLRAALGV